MSQLGIGAMLHYLSGGSQNSADKYYGKKIIKAEMVNDKLNIDFEDNTKISIWDDGQSCCESRYMTCDDVLSDIVGKTLIEIKVKESEPIAVEEGYEVHEIAFLEVATNDCSITLATHNEHNGYYGGFGLTITERD